MKIAHLSLELNDSTLTGKVELTDRQGMMGK